MMKLKTVKDENVKGNIELFGNRRVIVEGCKGVIDYSEDFLKLDLGNIALKIVGKNLVIDSFIYEELDLKGEIVLVEFMN
jgi:sporulation protein YqfC